MKGILLDKIGFGFFHIFKIDVYPTKIRSNIHIFFLGGRHAITHTPLPPKASASGYPFYRCRSIVFNDSFKLGSIELHQKTPDRSLTFS
jgi:hypothetical protein